MFSFKHKVVPSYCSKQGPKLLVFDNLIDLVRNIKFSKTPVDTGRKLNVHKTLSLLQLTKIPIYTISQNRNTKKL